MPVQDGKQSGHETWRFDSFEVRGRSGALLYKGRRIRIQELPFRMLLVLLENSGQVVSREELQRNPLEPGHHR